MTKSNKKREKSSSLIARKCTIIEKQNVINYGIAMVYRNKYDLQE
jgi:hypothetical protein